MKNKIKLISIISLAVFVIISAIACDDSNKDDAKHDNQKTQEKKELPTHYTGELKFENQQVWVHNLKAHGINDAYFKFADKSEIDVNISVLLESDEGYESVSAGMGKINQSILSFNVPELTQEQLQEWDYLKNYIFREWRILNSISIDDPNVMCNFIMFDSNAGKLNLEGLFGNAFSIGMKSIVIIYTDRDCTITGVGGEDYLSGSYNFTASDINLTLKKGWNMVCRRESYAQSGVAAISVEIVNPYDFRWVIYN
jgi:hypothetical protein